MPQSRRYVVAAGNVVVLDGHAPAQDHIDRGHVIARVVSNVWMASSAACSSGVGFGFG